MFTRFEPNRQNQNRAPMSTKMMLMASSLTHARPIACAAASAFIYPSRLVSQPPDLIKWVRREGGFVHKSIKITYLEEENRNGLGLGLGLVASEDIPKGSDLITLPQHIPLRFEVKDGEPSTLTDLARYIPGTYFQFCFIFLWLYYFPEYDCFLCLIRTIYSGFKDLFYGFYSFLHTVTLIIFL